MNKHKLILSEADDIELKIGADDVSPVAKQYMELKKKNAKWSELLEVADKLFRNSGRGGVNF